MENNVNATALKQDNLFEQGKFKYYIQFRKGNNSFAINVGESTYLKMVKLLKDEKPLDIKK